MAIAIFVRVFRRGTAEGAEALCARLRSKFADAQLPVTRSIVREYWKIPDSHEVFVESSVGEAEPLAQFEQLKDSIASSWVVGADEQLEKSATWSSEGGEVSHLDPAVFFANIELFSRR